MFCIERNKGNKQTTTMRSALSGIASPNFLCTWNTANYIKNLNWFKLKRTHKSWPRSPTEAIMRLWTEARHGASWWWPHKNMLLVSILGCLELENNHFIKRRMHWKFPKFKGAQKFCDITHNKSTTANSCFRKEFWYFVLCDKN